MGDFLVKKRGNGEITNLLIEKVSGINNNF
jgi:hypothetical protein